MKNGLPLLLLALLLQAPAAAAQTPADAKDAAEAERAQEEIGRRALALVGEALADAQSLKLPENRVRASALAARLLWPRDPKAARAAFKAAADDLAELNASIDPEDPQLYNAAATVAQLRADLVNAAAPYDAALALDFLRATRPSYTEALAAAGYGMPWQEQSLEMSVVSYVVAQDPKRALEIAEESLNRGVTVSLVNVVQNLRAKEPAAAAKLAADIVRRLSPEDLRAQSEAAAAAQQLLTLTRPAENLSPSNAVANSAGPDIVSVTRLVPDANGGAPLLDEQTRRELIEKVLSAASNVVTNQGGGYTLFYALQALLPELEKSAPARAAALRRKTDEMGRVLNPYDYQMRPYQELTQTGTVDAVLEAARKAPAEVRDRLYLDALWKAYNADGDAERARRILESVANPQQRAQARRELEQRERWRVVSQGGYAEARQTLARMKAPADKAQALMQLAERAASAGDVEAARQFLEDARSLVESQTTGQPQFTYRLRIANAYARFDPGSSFEAAESAVARLDALMDAAEAVDGFGQNAFEEGELKQQGGYVWNDLINQCAQTLAALARIDYERAAAAAKKSRRLDARTSTELIFAQTVLGSLPNVKRRPPAPLIIDGGK